MTLVPSGRSLLYLAHTFDLKQRKRNVMNQTETMGALSAQEEFFYPDTPLGPLPHSLRLVMPKNGRPGIQLLLKADGALPLSLESDVFTAEWFRMHRIPVEYNTGNGEDQGGAMVLMERPAQKPAYATRLAPFEVYDCLEPIGDTLDPEQGLAALYFCLVPRDGIPAGNHTAQLHVGDFTCQIEVHVYDVTIPEGTFPVTNWFSLSAIARLHRLEQGTPAFYEMVRKYARAMKRAHQTMFYFELDDRCVVSRDPYVFDFSYLEPLARCFFEEGLTTIEIGPLLSRGFLPDGMPNMYTDRFTCAMAPDQPIDTQKDMQSPCAMYGPWLIFSSSMAGKRTSYSTFMMSPTSTALPKPWNLGKSSIIWRLPSCGNTCPALRSSKPFLLPNSVAV